MKEKIKQRCEIDDKYKWDLSKIYKSSEEVENDLNKILSLTKEFKLYENHLLDSDKTLLEAINKYYEIIRTIDKLVVYANMKHHEDMSISENLALVKKIDNICDKIFSDISFFTPELLKSNYTVVEKYMNENNELKKYEFVLKDTFRTKEHTLTKEIETLLASLGEVFRNPSDTFDMIDDVDLKFSDIKDEDGNIVELNNSTYSKYIKSNNRETRKEAFTSLYNGYDGLKNTISSTFKGNLKVDSFLAKTRKYANPITMSLDNDDISEDLYNKLINKVNERMDLLHQYVELRKEILNLNEMHMYDLYVPLVKNIDKKYTYEEAKELVIKALSPLGDNYIKDLKNLFDSKCIDVFNNKNKRSGAYSWGSYDTLPYVLLNFSGTFNDVSTIAHELGHSMHSFYSHKNKEYHDASYPIFLAEIASTVNEILLNRYCYLNAKDNNEKLYYLNNLMEHIRTTLYRQTQFAEFEAIVHMKTFNDEILTCDDFCNIYYDLNKKYYGPSVINDDLIRLEWARIPHFYNSFYVYKYATGISIACKIANDILNNKENAVSNYMKFLGSGGFDYPLEILKSVGIDIANDNTIDDALSMFEETLKEFKKIKK